MPEVRSYAEARLLAEGAFPYALTGGVHSASRGFEDDEDFYVPWEHEDPNAPPVVSGVRSSWVFVAKESGRVRAEFPPDVFVKVDAMTACE